MKSKKKSHINQSDPLFEFRRFFKRSHKLAMVRWFFIIAEADGTLNIDERKHIENIIWTLGISLCELAEEYPFTDKIDSVLYSLSSLQKEWLILTTQALIECDEKITPKELAVLNHSFGLIGISEQDIRNALSKPKTIGNYIIYG